MIYFIQAKVQIKVLGISGLFEDTFTQLVSANSSQEARTKFEQHVRKLKSSMNADKFFFQYLIVADTI